MGVSSLAEGKLPRAPFPALNINSKVSFYDPGAYRFPKEKLEAKVVLYRKCHSSHLEAHLDHTELRVLRVKKDSG